MNRGEPAAACITREYLKDFFALGGSAEDQKLLNTIVSQLVPQEFPHNSYICRAGDQADALYFIESGLAQVRGQDHELLNELMPGRYFGEYAALTGDKRMADIQANGTVLVYRLDRAVLQDAIRHNPKLYGVFLKRVYGEATNQYRKLVRALNLKRHTGPAPAGKKLTPLKLFINYYLVFLIFFNLLLFCPDPRTETLHPLLLISPTVFLVGYIAITRRALESLTLACLYLAIMLAGPRFIGSFSSHIIKAVTETPDIILMVFLMGALTRLFSASGSINALKKAAERVARGPKGALTSAFCATIFLAIEEYLCVIIHSACFKPLADSKRIPREKSAIIMGMTPGALCMLNPLSLTGIYLAGVMYKAGGNSLLFIHSLPFNFAAFLVLAFTLLLALEKLPLTGSLKKAVLRAQSGGNLWPEGTEEEAGEEAANQGRIGNLLLPILVLISSSGIAGSLEAGTFTVNVLYGLVITLIFCFFLYCFQRYMTPDQFFRNIIFGIEGMLAPVILFVLGASFAAGMEEIGFPAWLNGMVRTAIGGRGWMLPALIFACCALIGALFDSPWAMYVMGIPIALELAASLNGVPGLYMGAVCAAGLLGNEIALGDIFFTGPMLGINPAAYYRAKLPYVLLITALAFTGYLAAGFLLD